MSHNTPTKAKSLINIAVINEPTYDSKISDEFILIKTKGSVVINLPEGINGKKITIKNGSEDSHAITVKPYTGETIDTMGMYEFSLPLESISLIFVEKNWFIV